MPPRGGSGGSICDRESNSAWRMLRCGAKPGIAVCSFLETSSGVIVPSCLLSAAIVPHGTPTFRLSVRYAVRDGPLPPTARSPDCEADCHGGVTAVEVS